MVKTFFTDENFWEKLSELTNIEPFKTLYKEDKSKNKEKSSKIMWGIALCYDYNSKLRNLTEQERLNIIEKDVWNGRLSEDLLITLKNSYNKLQQNSIRRYIAEWDEKLDERRLFIKNLTYDEKTWDVIDKMLLSTEKLILQRESIIKMVEKIESETTRGDVKPSLLEKDEI